MTGMLYVYRYIAQSSGQGTGILTVLRQLVSALDLRRSQYLGVIS